MRLYFLILTFLPEYTKSEVPKPCAEVHPRVLQQTHRETQGNRATPVGYHANYQLEAIQFQPWIVLHSLPQRHVFPKPGFGHFQTKSKSCAKANVAQEVRVSVSRKSPRSDRICSAQEEHAT